MGQGTKARGFWQPEVQCWVGRSLGVVTASVLLLMVAPAVQANHVSQARFSLSTPSGGPFPSNLFTVPDASQQTGVRVHLPLPNCAQLPSECADLVVINTLDGFNIQPQIAIPFDQAIDPMSLMGRSIFLVHLGDTQPKPGVTHRGKIIGLNQIVWDPATLTVYAEADELLEQHTRYGVIVTRAVRDQLGRSVKPSAEFRAFLEKEPNDTPSTASQRDYRRQILDAIQVSLSSSRTVVAASVFTTQSTTADLEKIRVQIKADSLPSVNFVVGVNKERTVFPLSSIQSFMWMQQTGTAPSFDTAPTFLEALQVVPGAIGTLAFGAYSSPNYETADRVIPSVATLTGTPQVQGTNEIAFTLFLPAGRKPTSGWPVAIFGHGFTDSKQGAPFAVAATLAQGGIATVAINVVGHGGGPLGTLTVMTQDGHMVTFPDGGRGIDQNGDGAIDSTEGVSAALSQGIVSSRDGLRQTVVDLMQLVREIQLGVDVDNDGRADLDAQRIYYAGQSFGGIYGTIFLAVEPDVHAGVPNVPGGSVIEVARLGEFRPLVGAALHFRLPALDNLPPTVTPSFTVFNFNENIPLRSPFPIVNTVPGAIAIQHVLENTEWVSQAGDPVAYAQYLKQPLAGVPAKSVIIQFARGDETVPNPTTTALLRAGNLADRATFFRNDLAYKGNSSFPKNPHTFLTNLDPANLAVTAVALAAQAQITTFFASDGTVIIDPDGPAPLFETPIVGPLPEDLGFLP